MLRSTLLHPRKEPGRLADYGDSFMQLTRRSGLKLALAPLALAILGPSAVRADAGIGAVSEIDNELWGTVTGAARQALGVSAQVFRKQRLETGDDSAAVVKFIDQSQLSLGENANLVVDEYVYAGAKSRSAVMLGKGAFRFLSGQMPEKNMKLNTPTVGIGIRGTELLIDVYEDGSTEVSTISGAANVVSAITNEVLDVLAGQSVLADAEGVFIGGVRDFIHKSADEAIQREINKLRSKSPIPLPDILNPFR